MNTNPIDDKGVFDAQAHAAVMSEDAMLAVCEQALMTPAAMLTRAAAAAMPLPAPLPDAAHYQRAWRARRALVRAIDRADELAVRYDDMTLPSVLLSTATALSATTELRRRCCQQASIYRGLARRGSLAVLTDDCESEGGCYE